MSALERARAIAVAPIWLACAAGFVVAASVAYVIDVLARLTRR